MLRSWAVRIHPLPVISLKRHLIMSRSTPHHVYDENKLVTGNFYLVTGPSAHGRGRCPSVPGPDRSHRPAEGAGKQRQPQGAPTQP